MQTTYASELTAAKHGMPVLAPRVSRPRQLPQLPQILTLTVANGAGTTDLTLTLVDDKTGQSYTLVVTGSANEATLGAALRAAWAASPKLNSLFSIAATTETSGQDIVEVFTARHANRSYTLSSTGGPANTAGTVVETQAPGGSGLTFGQLVVQGTADDEFGVMTASSTVAQIVGFLFRMDGNHFHALPTDLSDEDPSNSDLCERGVHYAIAEEGEFWVTVQEAVTPASRVYVRVEGTTVGDWGDSPAGTGQTVTITPVVNNAVYGFSFAIQYNGQRIEIDATYMPTDGTTSIADACAGLFDAVTADIAAKGLTSILTPTDNSTTLTIAVASGYLVSEPSGNVWTLDTEQASVVIAVDTADVDMLDVSSIARYMTTAASGGLARVKIDLQP